MPALGFRCHKDAVAYIALGGYRDAPQVLDHGFTRMPRGERGDQLVWLRQEIHEILDRFRPDTVSFKAAESVARTKDLERAEAEGVLQEAVRAHGGMALKRIKSQIRADLGFTRPARYLDEALAVGALDDLPGNRREAALVALAALPDA